MDKFGGGLSMVSVYLPSTLLMADIRREELP
jgi:hypothetical protein